MPNPFDFIHELREVNEKLFERLDTIEAKLDILMHIIKENKVDWYGDGK